MKILKLSRKDEEQERKRMEVCSEKWGEAKNAGQMGQSDK